MTERPLRIAVWHNLSSGGAKRALYYHVRGLVDRGHHVEAWCPPTADRTYLPLSSLITEHVVALDLSTPKLLRVLQRVGLRHRVTRVMAAMDQHCRAVANEIGDDFDIVLASSCQHLAVGPLGIHVRPPSLLYLQEPNRRLYEAIRLVPWLDPSRVVRAATRKQGRGELRGIGAYDRVLVNSRYSRESVWRAYGVDSHVCYLGIDTDLFQPASSPSRDYVVGVGAFTPEKNIELALAALGRMDAPRPPLVWIGDHAISDEYVRGLVALAADLGVPFTPRRSISDAELVALLSGARAMVYAPRLEPFGFAPLEANACGVPVVAGAEGGVREAVVDEVNGLLVESHPDALAAALERLWQNPFDAAALGMSGHEHVLKCWGLTEAVDRLEHHVVEVSRGAVEGRDLDPAVGEGRE